MICPHFSPANADLALRLVIAAVLGGAIGLERDLRGRPAGLRTHALVCLGAALFTILSFIAAGSLNWDGSAGTGAHDPGRIAAQIVTGIGFLGAGTILKSQFSIRGLTTASCLWLVAAIGMCCGVGLYCLAMFATGLALLFLIGVHQLERCLPKEQYHQLTITVKGREHDDEIRQLVRDSGAKILADSYSYDFGTGVSVLRFSLRRRGRDDRRGRSHEAVERLESMGLPLLRVEWDPAEE